jgi:hypothetical protein
MNAETPRDPKAEAAAAKAYAKAQRPWYKKKRFIIPLGLIILTIAAAAGSGGKDSSKTADSDTASQTQDAPDASSATTDTPAADPKPASCGKKATDDCTPHVNLGGSVRVDALVWKVKSVSTATQIGDQRYGLGAKADGRFVVVSLSVHSDRNESATLTDNVFQLEVGGNKYDTDSDGTFAAIGSGQQPLFLEDIGPDADVRGKVVFDVPTSVLSKKVEMRFNELGFGSTHGYIDISSRLG